MSYHSYNYDRPDDNHGVVQHLSNCDCKCDHPYHNTQSLPSLSDQVKFAADTDKSTLYTSVDFSPPSTEDERALQEKAKKILPPARGDSFHGTLAAISPGSRFVFETFGDEDEAACKLHITNLSEGLLVYKVKTTAPDSYRVRPSTGSIRPDMTAEVIVNLLPGHSHIADKDKFLIMVAEVDHDSITSYEVADLWKKAMPQKNDPTKYMEHRLFCVVNHRDTPIEPLSPSASDDENYRRLSDQNTYQQHTDSDSDNPYDAQSQAYSPVKPPTSSESDRPYDTHSQHYSPVKPPTSSESDRPHDTHSKAYSPVKPPTSSESDRPHDTHSQHYSTTRSYPTSQSYDKTYKDNQPTSSDSDQPYETHTKVYSKPTSRPRSGSSHRAHTRPESDYHTPPRDKKNKTIPKTYVETPNPKTRRVSGKSTTKSGVKSTPVPKDDGKRTRKYNTKSPGTPPTNNDTVHLSTKVPEQNNKVTTYLSTKSPEQNTQIISEKREYTTVEMNEILNHTKSLEARVNRLFCFEIFIAVILLFIAALLLLLLFNDAPPDVLLAKPGTGVED